MKKPPLKIAAGSPEWEARCARCGRCCFEKIDYLGKIFYTKTPCDYLDQQTNSCRIYEQRDVLHPDCARLTPDLVVAGFLPADCPYVADLNDYNPPQLDGGLDDE